MPSTGVEQQLYSRTTQRPERTRSLDQCAGVLAFKAACAADVDGGIVGRNRYTYLRVCGIGTPLAGSDVGTAFKHLRRHPYWYLWQCQIEGRGRQGETGCRDTGERADGMLKLGARDAYVNRLGARLVKLGLCQGHIRFGRYPTGEPCLGQVKILFVLLRGVVEQSLLGVETPQLKVVQGQLRAQAHIHVPQ